ncbi:RagB/SusD family nutrient uptake outer membrane protein [Flaviaesturariibacter flavus]|uniref:RagB/SusD family nutrient uptake outer membrane protein n=1 Tax=Flaviaesturariibacter flavus TaxID=2502780 RepID=A0A4R1BB82_9BACT|nr:RagB/SusD family nutrient uptake outer membrane protein [Flaviaesturariibacter flavus]TCJ14240.1 RagB/SusD family nutrient uptake outer membrane protein [Flaviaesturariibacter flavus]
MKMLSIKSGFLCLGLAIMAGGCKKFLDQPVQGTLPETEFYKTDDEINQGTIAIYDMMQAHYNNNWASPYMVKTMLTDESNAGGSNDGDQPGYQQLDDYNFSANNDKVRDSWRLFYYSIYRSNKVIGRTQASNPLRRRLVAEAKALRAYNYLEVVSLWGDAPLVLEDLVPSQFTNTPRRPKAEIYAQIEKDLNEAIPDLPLKSTYPANDRFRISKGAAQAILGKALLYQKKYAAAATAFDAVISSGQYSLEPSIGKVFSQSGEFGRESLFEISYTNMRNYDWGNFPWGGAPESNIHIQLMGPRADFYTKAPSDSLLAGWGFNLPRQGMWDAFTNAGDINRRKATIMSKAELVAAGGNWTNDNAWDFQGYFQRKYGSFQTQTGNPVGELNYGTNWRLIRYADVLLMAAEANLNGPSAANALTYVNLVRQRPGTALPALTSVTMDDIMRERQLELAFEGHRFQDLVRWGRAAQVLGPLGFVAGKHELLPIPQFDVQSGNLTQNNGF